MTAFATGYENKKRDWKKIVSESNGRSLFLPASFVGRAEKIEEMRADYNKEVNKMAKKEISMNMETHNMFFDLRNYLEKNGIPQIWLEEIGFNEGALADGEFVINLLEKNK